MIFKFLGCSTLASPNREEELSSSMDLDGHTEATAEYVNCH